MPHLIEEQGTKLLIAALEAKGHKVERLNGTLDISVDGIPAEVKTKRKKFNQLDHISLTSNQFAEAQKRDFLIYLICDLDDKPEIYKINSKDLLSSNPRIITSYEYGLPSFKQRAELIIGSD